MEVPGCVGLHTGAHSLNRSTAWTKGCGRLWEGEEVREHVGEKESWNTNWFCRQEVIWLLEAKPWVHWHLLASPYLFSTIGALQRKSPQVWKKVGSFSCSGLETAGIWLLGILTERDTQAILVNWKGNKKAHYPHGSSPSFLPFFITSSLHRSLICAYL